MNGKMPRSIPMALTYNWRQLGSQLVDIKQTFGNTRILNAEAIQADAKHWRRSALGPWLKSPKEGVQNTKKRLSFQSIKTPIFKV